MNVEQRIRAIEDRLKLLDSGDLDMGGRRVKGAGRALAGSDLLTLGQARDLIASPESTRVLEQRLETVGGGPFGIPVSIGDANQQGSSQQYADAQHVHASGLTTKGDLLGYSTTTTRVAVSATNGESLYALSTATPGVAYGSGWKGAKSKTLSDNVAASLFEVALASVGNAGGAIAYTARSANATVAQTESGLVTFSAVNDASGIVSTITKHVSTQALTASGPSTFTSSFAITNGAGKITVTFTANPDHVPTTLEIRYFLLSCDVQTVTFL